MYLNAFFKCTPQNSFKIFTESWSVREREHVPENVEPRSLYNTSLYNTLYCIPCYKVICAESSLMYFSHEISVLNVQRRLRRIGPSWAAAKTALLQDKNKKKRLLGPRNTVSDIRLVQICPLVRWFQM